MNRVLWFDPNVHLGLPLEVLPNIVVDMAYFVADHDDHHLASIREIVREGLSSP